MGKGCKARGGEAGGKWMNPRHGTASKRGANAVEKALETKERRRGKEAIRKAQMDI